MLSKFLFLSNRIKFEEDLIIRSKQLKKNKINHCFIQKPDPNFFTIAESRNPKCGIIDGYSESD